MLHSGGYRFFANEPEHPKKVTGDISVRENLLRNMHCPRALYETTWNDER